MRYDPLPWITEDQASCADDGRYDEIADGLAAEWARTAKLAIAGVLLGLVLAELFAWASGRPGVGVMVGF